MKTYTAKAKDITRDWHLFDATDQVLGKMATEIAEILMGKNKAMYTRNLDTGDYVVVINASKIKLTGKKLEQKYYYRHSGYPGGFRSEQLSDVLAKKPETVILHAVKGMLPQNKLGCAMLKKLKVYAGAEHPHGCIAATKQLEN